jgi:hypothetical protein
VGGEAKAGQDIARALLSEFSAFWGEGNQLLDLVDTAQPFGLSEALVQQYISEAVNRLITQQQTANHDTRLLSIVSLRTRVVGLSTAVFYLQVLVDSGALVTVSDYLALQPTQLNQVDSASVLKV